MTKFTIAADLHLKHENMEKIVDLFMMFEEIGNPVILAGDILDNKEIIRGKCLNLLYHQLCTATIPYYILIGNHDYFNADCIDHSLRVLEKLDNVHIIEVPTEFHTLDCAMIPYCSTEEFYKEIEQYRGKVSTLIIHQGIDGFDFGNGYIEHNGVSIDALKGFDLVISGHFHKQQEQDNLIYIGSPFSHNYGESNQDKFIGIWTPQAKSIELIRTEFPRHMTYELDANETYEDIHNLIENKDDNNRIIVTGKQDRVDFVAGHIQKNHPTIKVISKADEEGYNSSVDETQDNIMKFVTWAKEVKALDDETIDLGKEILERYV
jgi:DNA repair exonuclease SbcCD nuclease subunit